MKANVHEDTLEDIEPCESHNEKWCKTNNVIFFTEKGTKFNKPFSEKKLKTTRRLISTSVKV